MKRSEVSEVQSKANHPTTQINSNQICRTETEPGSNLVWQVMDCRSLEFDDESFDAVIDKGCYDTLLTSEESTSSIQKYLAHVARVLKPEGKFMCISVWHPDELLEMLSNQDYSWKVEYEFLTKPIIGGVEEKMDPDNNPTSVHYLYVCTMGSDDE